MWEILFWISVFIVFYTYLGYGLLIDILVRLKNLLLIKKNPDSETELPIVNFLIAAYNEAYIIEDKILNTLSLDYDRGKMTCLCVTDGSTDSTNQIVKKFPEVSLYFQPDRRGKVNAVNRIIPHLSGDIIIFSDANTMLNNEAIKNLVRHFANPKVGMVAGEKTILRTIKETASRGEGLYWRYESWLKKNDAEIGSVIGAAGELFAIRRSLLETVPEDIIIEDFYLSLRVIQKGYTIAYEPQAVAVETGSASVKEEIKRKVRISAGGLQAIYRMAHMLNIFRYKMPAFQFLSHRVLRWTLTPLALPAIFIFNVALAIQENHWFYQLSLITQILLYSIALIKHYSGHKNKLMVIIYYFVIMNLSVYLGFIRLIKGKQSVVWEKSKRMVIDNNN